MSEMDDTRGPCDEVGNVTIENTERLLRTHRTIR
jgi:hypothetical protein